MKIDDMAAEAQREADNSISAAVDAIKKARLAEQRARAQHRSTSTNARIQPNHEVGGDEDGDEDDDEDDDDDDDEDRDTIAPEHRVLRRHTRECELRLLSLLQQQGLEQYAPFIFANSGGGVAPAHSRATREGLGGSLEARHTTESATEFDNRTSGRRSTVSRALEAIEDLMKRRVAEAKNTQHAGEQHASATNKRNSALWRFCSKRFVPHDLSTPSMISLTRTRNLGVTTHVHRLLCGSSICSRPWQ